MRSSRKIPTCLFTVVEGCGNGVSLFYDPLGLIGSQIVLKMDKDGNAFELRRDRLTENSIPDFEGLTARQIQQLCILSGCDYLPSIRGIGLKRASKLLRQHKTVDNVVKELRSLRWADIPDDYVDQFRRAELTFLHQRVFDPRQGRAVPLHPLQDVNDEEMQFIGP